MLKNSIITPNSWLAFDLSVLRHMRFKSIALPFMDEPNLGMYLKRLNVRVACNDLLPSAYAKSLAQVGNNGERLKEEIVNVILDSANMQYSRPQNTALRNWFSEEDAIWFDSLRRNIEQIPSTTQKAIALNIGLETGDYVLSFTPDTQQLRQPLADVYRRFWKIQPKPINNGQNNHCANKTAKEFVAESFVDLMFLRLPRAHTQSIKNALGWTAWREEWIRGGDYFWSEMENRRAGKLGTHTETKSQYLQMLEGILRTASHIRKWAIAHVEDGFITTPELVEIFGRVRRRVDTIFTKDFSELAGTKAVVITA